MTTMTEYDRVITIDVPSGGKITGIALAIGEYPEEGSSTEDDNFIVYMYEHNFPEEACKDFGYFMTNYWYDLENGSFVKVKSAQPNQYATYNIETETWSWDAASVLSDIRRERNALIGMTDWTQLPDVTITDAQKTEVLEYRVKLRNITNGLDNPVDTSAVDWPTPPSFI